MAACYAESSTAPILQRAPNPNVGPASRVTAAAAATMTLLICTLLYLQALLSRTSEWASQTERNRLVTCPPLPILPPYSPTVRSHLGLIANATMRGTSDALRG